MAKKLVTFRFHERTIRKLIRLAEANSKTKTAIAESLIWNAQVIQPAPAKHKKVAAKTSVTATAQ